MDGVLSIWEGESGAPGAHRNFLGTGVLVAPKMVLTARHLIVDDDAGRTPAERIWVQPFNLRGNAQMPRCLAVREHPRLDVALLTLELPVGEKAWSLDPAVEFDRTSGAYQLAGYYEGRFETPDPATVLGAVNDDDGPAVYHTKPRHDVGYSGSPLILRGRVWGLAVSHQRDLPTIYRDADGQVQDIDIVPNHRGCVVAVHQFSDWLHGHGVPMTKQGEMPPAVDDRGAELWRDQLQQMRRNLLAAFKPKEVRDLEVVEMDGDLPRDVARALRDAAAAPSARSGEALLQAVFGVVRALGDAAQDERLTLKSPARKALRAALEAAVGNAALTCLDPARVDAIRNSGVAVALDDMATNAAMLPLRREPHRTYRLRDERLVDDHHLTFVESGEGRDMTDAIERGAWRHRMNPRGGNAALTEGERRELMQRLTADAAQGRTLLVVRRGSMTEHTLEPPPDEVRAALDRLGVRLVLLMPTGGCPTPYWIDADRVLGLLTAAYERLDRIQEKSA